MEFNFEPATVPLDDDFARGIGHADDGEIQTLLHRCENVILNSRHNVVAVWDSVYCHVVFKFAGATPPRRFGLGRMTGGGQNHFVEFRSASEKPAFVRLEVIGLTVRGVLDFSQFSRQPFQDALGVNGKRFSAIRQGEAGKLSGNIFAGRGFDSVFQNPASIDFDFRCHAIFFTGFGSLRFAVRCPLPM